MGTCTFVISDTHFGHANILTFEGGRPEFSCVEEMDEHMVERWNSVVRPGDKVYHVGDVAIKKKALKIMGRLNGRKTLIAGNHDIFNTKEYLPYFDNMRGSRVIDNHIITHIPLHERSQGRFVANVHGHTHRFSLDSSWYFNVSAEVVGYTPVSWDEVKLRVRQRQEGVR